MEILYATKKLESLCLNEKKAKRELGGAGFRKLRARLKDIEAARSVRDLVVGRPHPLRGDRAGQIAIVLDGGQRLVFEPAMEEIPTKPDGGIAWDEVTSIRILFIGDYHD